MRRRTFLSGLAFIGGAAVHRWVSTSGRLSLSNSGYEPPISVPGFGKLVRIRSNAAAYDFAQHAAGDTAFLAAASPVGVYYQGELLNGFGATHLLRGMGTASRTAQRVVATSSERIVTYFARCRSERSRLRLRDFYGNAGALFIDDLSFLSGKVQAQAELGMIVERLLSDGRAVAFTCVPPADEIRWCGARLRSILGFGTRLFVGRPTLGELQAILRQKALESGFPVPDEPLFAMAALIETMDNWNIRAAVGLLLMAIATANWTGSPLTEELTRTIFLERFVDRRSALAPSPSAFAIALDI